ncbi:MAG TPA: carboxypeptidase regulatory-like domain-containing protein, partial [Holophagaceae bacterium]|nr:carboxypeptidase regulatory-like domain-containing protein [Holophagaceae bacterium]
MNRFHPRLGALAFALAAGPAALMAQETGTLAVTVRNQEGAPLANAKIIVSSPTQIGGAKTALSDDQGRVRIPSLYPGDFTVTVEAAGYQSGTLKGVHIGVSSTTKADLKLVPLTEAIVVITASAATLDPTTATSGVRLSTETLDSLPTGRTYTDFVRFAPGVISSPDSGSDFAVAGSLSRDNTGAGGARNNTYILDGVDTTNPQTGGSLSRFNSEIIQEQEIKTGGIQADVAARGGGLVSNVITKSGSNTWAGSLNYYLQNDSLVAKRKPGVLTKDSKFNSFDTAFTLGGPILKDRWWFFASLQKQNTTTDGEFKDTATPTPVAKNAEQDDLLAFFKTTFQINANNTLELSLTDNRSKDKSLGADSNIPGFDSDRDRNQRISNLRYEGVFNDWVITAKGFMFSSDATPKPKVAGDALTIVFPDAAYNGLPDSGSVANYQKQAGGFGWYTKTKSERTGFSLDVAKFQAQLLGDHQFKAGLVQQEETRSSNLQHAGSGADYEYLAKGTANALTWGDVLGNYSGASWADDSYVPGALDRARASNPALDAYLNSIGATVTPTGTDYSSLPFQTLAPGSTDRILEYRIAGLRYGNDAKVKRKSFDYYLQDTWTLPGNQWTAYLGARFNKDAYYADDGTKLHSTELNIAPRLGLTYNHKGENKLKVYATYGRYFEPIKLDMVTFAGSFANARLEQMYIPYQGSVGTYDPANWVTLRQRGGRET